MKNTILLLILTFIFGLSVSAQTSPSEQLKDVRLQITQIENSLLLAEAKLADLQVRYSDDYVDVVKTKNQINELNQRLRSLKTKESDLSLAVVKTTKPTTAKESAVLLVDEIILSRNKLQRCFDDCNRVELQQRLGELYQKAIQNPEALNILFGSASDQQNAELLRLIVAQNQKIIALLEQLVKKK